MAVSLPRYLSLSVSVTVGTTTVPRFMEVVHEDVASHGLFIAKGDRILSPFSKLELVEAGSGLVHIRSCYNNMYLAVRSVTNHRISPVAVEPVEDQSAWSCTMFRVTTTSTQSSGVRVTVEHFHLGRRIVAREPDRILQVDQSGVGQFFDFAVHDVSAVLALRLPQFFTLKDINGRYGAVTDAVHPFPPRIRFLSTISNSVDTVYEILPVDAGSFRFRSLKNNRCWIVQNFDIMRAVDVTTSADIANLPAGHRWFEGLFNIHRVDDDNVVTISHFVSDFRIPCGLFVVPPDYLQAVADTTRPGRARFVLKEAVRSRSIYNFRYNVLGARLQLGHPRSMSTQTMNNGSSVSQSYSRTFTYNETTSTRWNATVSSTVSVSGTITVRVPLVAEKSITIGLEISAGYEWGEEHTTSLTKEDRLDITVPPMTRIAVSRWESQGSYDIPFSYTQEDILYNGQRVVLEKHDGLAIGINNHDIFYNVVEQPLASTISGEEVAREYRNIPNSSRIVSPPNDPSPSLADPAAAE